MSSLVILDNVNTFELHNLITCGIFLVHNVYRIYYIFCLFISTAMCHWIRTSWNEMVYSPVKLTNEEFTCISRWTCLSWYNRTRSLWRIGVLYRSIQWSRYLVGLTNMVGSYLFRHHVSVDLLNGGCVV